MAHSLAKSLSTELHIAYMMAGYREVYAMEYGNLKVVYKNGKRYLKFTYSKEDSYQDANGATFDTVNKKWVN